MKWPTSKLGYTAAGMTVLCGSAGALLAHGTIHERLHQAWIACGRNVQRRADGAHNPGGWLHDYHSQGGLSHLLQTEKPFVQLDWKPVSALPQHVSDAVDVDGDGQPDVRVSFDVPKDPKTPLRVDVDALNLRYQAMRNVGKPKFSELIVRLDDAILVRVPLTEH